MDYSNESFERFQQAISKAHGNDSLHWSLRDALFAEAFYGKANRLRKLFRFPGGWLVALLAQYVRERRGAESAYPESPPDACHYLFLSTRNNHTRRLMPLLESEMGEGRACVAWYGVPGIPELAPASLQPVLHSVAGAWTRHIRFPDIQEASRLTRELEAILPEDLDAPKLAAIRVYLVQFMAWRRFWLERLQNRPSKIISTFEKAPRVKAFFHAAWELGIPDRIHWVHGLRHASIQATLASELWCMTPGDVRFFKERVPNFCTPRVRKNPEAAELAAAIGVLDPASLRQDEPIHFLFLGPGLEASYAKEMRMADLAVISKIQHDLGDRISWRFRPHPSASDRFRAELTAAGIEVQDFSTRHLHDDLKWSHAVGSSWSSLLLDIRETGRHIFWVQAEIRTLGAVDELIADGIGIHLSKSSKSIMIFDPK